MTYIKSYLKRVADKIDPERADAFKKGAQEFVKFVISKFDEFEFYTGVSEDTEGSIVYSYWEDESGAGPVFYYFKDALREVKC